MIPVCSRMRSGLAALAPVALLSLLAAPLVAEAREGRAAAFKARGVFKERLKTDIEVVSKAGLITFLRGGGNWVETPNAHVKLPDNRVDVLTRSANGSQQLRSYEIRGKIDVRARTLQPGAKARLQRKLDITTLAGGGLVFEEQRGHGTTYTGRLERRPSGMLSMTIEKMTARRGPQRKLTMLYDSASGLMLVRRGGKTYRFRGEKGADQMKEVAGGAVPGLRLFELALLGAEKGVDGSRLVAKKGSRIDPSSPGSTAAQESRRQAGRRQAAQRNREMEHRRQINTYGRVMYP